MTWQSRTILAIQALAIQALAIQANPIQSPMSRLLRNLSTLAAGVVASRLLAVKRFERSRRRSAASFPALGMSA